MMLTVHVECDPAHRLALTSLLDDTGGVVEEASQHQQQAEPLELAACGVTGPALVGRCEPHRDDSSPRLSKAPSGTLCNSLLFRVREPQLFLPLR
ncbi:unnamed protein product [Lampetra fluviatilis]